MKRRLACLAIFAGWIAVTAFDAPPREAGKAPPSVFQIPSPREMPSGTICFSFRWVQPDEKSFLTLLQLDGSDGMVRLYIYPHRTLGFLVLRTFKDRSRNETLPASRRLIDRWREQPGGVHRIVLTWSPEESRLYLDGFLVSSSTAFAKKPVSFSRIVWGSPGVFADRETAPDFPGNRYELGKLEIKPEVMAPEAVIADWRTVNGERPETDSF